MALAAMQLMTSVDGASLGVTVTSYRFSIVTLVAIAASCTVLIALHAALYLWNWALILVIRRSQQS
jgi:hypothetical protein